MVQATKMTAGKYKWQQHEVICLLSRLQTTLFASVVVHGTLLRALIDLGQGEVNRGTKMRQVEGADVPTK